MVSQVDFYLKSATSLPVLARALTKVTSYLRFARFSCCHEYATFVEIQRADCAPKTPAQCLADPFDPKSSVLERMLDDLAGPHSRIKLAPPGKYSHHPGFRIGSNFTNGVHVVTLSLCYSGMPAWVKYLLNNEYTSTATLVGTVLPDHTARTRPDQEATMSLYNSIVRLSGIEENFLRYRTLEEAGQQDQHPEQVDDGEE